MNPENAIEIRNMSKSFKVQYDQAHDFKSLLLFRNRGKATRLQVLKDINLDIKKGDTVGLIGSNGSGKSTLLKLMTKIYYPNEGTLVTDGKVTSLLELGAGFHPDFTGRENIYFNAAIFGLTEQQIEQRIDDIIDFSELGKFIDEPIRTYSSGMYMRLAFSIAINVDADILLIDEILAVGDQHFQDKCYAKLKELKNSDKTIVIVSHSLEVLKDLCTRAVWIYHGEFKLDGDPIFVIQEYLKQIAIDNKEEKKKNVEQGKSEYTGHMFIDTPKNFTHVSANADYLHCHGWKLSDDENASFEVRIGEKTVGNLQYSPRPDVMEVYSEMYQGLVNENEIGFQVDIPLQEYVDQMLEDGSLHIVCAIKGQSGKVLAENEAVVILDKENA